MTRTTETAEEPSVDAPNQPKQPHLAKQDASTVDPSKLTALTHEVVGTAHTIFLFVLCVCVMLFLMLMMLVSFVLRVDCCSFLLCFFSFWPRGERSLGRPRLM